MKTIIVQGNKTLKLKNVLICELYNTIVDIDGDLINSQDNTLEMLVVQMTNQIKSKGSNVVGPLIQYSGMKDEDDDVGLSISLMIQASNYIKNLDPGYKMHNVIVSYIFTIYFTLIAWYNSKICE